MPGRDDVLGTLPDVAACATGACERPGNDENHHQPPAPRAMIAAAATAQTMRRGFAPTDGAVAAPPTGRGVHK